MINSWNKLLITGLICLTFGQGALAQYYYHDPQVFEETKGTNENTKELNKLVKNIATYFGIDAEKNYGDRADSSATLPATFDISDIKDTAKFIIFNTLYMNPLLGDVFKNFSNVSTNNVSAQSNFDAPFPGGTYGNTPTTQILLNNLSTVSDDNCYASPCVTKNQILTGVLDTSFLYQDPAHANPAADLSPNLLAQLNAESLLSPMQFQTAGSSGSGFGSPTSSSGRGGLPSQNSAQLAYNYIRYLSGILDPLTLPKRESFRGQLAKFQDENTEEESKKAILEEILSDVANRRAYAAQLSMGVSNLVHILARRMPNAALNDKSELQSEYEMASRRLYDAAKGSNEWHAAIEKASPITLQRETLYLLAEMNYQMYLNRQQNERTLALLSVMQLQSTAIAKSIFGGSEEALRQAESIDYKLPEINR